MNRFARSDRGIALPMVLGIGVLMLILVGTALTVVTSGLRQASTDQDRTAALDAAYAGIEDYMARLTVNPLYVADGNPNDTAFGTAGSRTMDATNKAFGIGAGGTWATVPGSETTHPAQFRYEVDNSTYHSNSTVRLRSTGLVGTTVRTIVANIRVRGFVDYLYFTDFEVQDPAITGSGLNCAVYAWAGRTSQCGTIRFAGRDVIQGPLHSNDTITSCGATFQGPVTSANPSDPLVATDAGCASAGTFAVPPQREPILPLPATNSEMRTEAATGGCLYTGPTTITYNANGTMTVVSPWTKWTNVKGAARSNPAACGTLTDLHSTGGATVPQLKETLLYVQNVPTDASDPNAWAANTTPANFSCLGSDGSTVISTTSGSAGWTFGSGAGALQHPLAGEFPATGWATSNGYGVSRWSTAPAAYGCTNGDIFVKGVDTTQTTMGSENYVYVTGDLTMADKSVDLLGVVGQNGVLVYNPMSSSGRPMLTDPNREIDASIMSVAHTFQVQNFDVGGVRGTLTIYGSIAQKYRGPVGTGTSTTQTTGYSKQYQYDPLLVTSGPPDFLAPSATTFTLSQYASVAPAFGTDGTLR